MRRFEDLPKAVANLRRKVAELDRLASRKGHGHVLGYAEVTANQTGITSETDLTGLSVTVDVAAGRRIKVSGDILATSTAADDRINLRIKESTTQLNARTGFAVVSDQGFGMSVVAVLTPSSGSHTYKLTLARQDGTGSVALLAGSTTPAFILVEDIGPA